ncbi:hypothetical protein LCGC14_2045220, partial [marine sediment metagenome]
ICKLPLREKTMEASGRGRPGVPSAVGLSREVEAVAGESDPELERLIAEQTKEFEDSPLVPNRPNPKLKKRV